MQYPTMFGIPSDDKTGRCEFILCVHNRELMCTLELARGEPPENVRFECFKKIKEKYWREKYAREEREAAALRDPEETIVD